MAAPKKPAAAGVNFLSTEFYSAGGGLPEGTYALEFAIQMYQATDKNGAPRGPERLGVMLTCHPLDEPSAEPRTQFYSMGAKAHLSFAPDPDSGKGLIPVAGGTATTLNKSTNWAIFLQSLFDCGLPPEVVSNDLTPLDGIHVRMRHIPEPEERKGFQSTTGDAAEERRPGTIAVVCEILEDGKPWEGTGGIPSAEEKPAAKTPAKAAPKPAAKPAPAAKVKAAPKAAPEPAGDDAMRDAAIAGFQSVLEANPEGLAKLKFRMEVFKKVKEAEGNDVALAVVNAFVADDAQLGLLLGEMGYALNGTTIAVA